jgi:hypothetical protein
MKKKILVGSFTVTVVVLAWLAFRSDHRSVAYSADPVDRIAGSMLEQQGGHDLGFSPDQVERIADDSLRSAARKKQ